MLLQDFIKELHPQLNEENEKNAAGRAAAC